MISAGVLIHGTCRVAVSLGRVGVCGVPCRRKKGGVEDVGLGSAVDTRDVVPVHRVGAATLWWG